MDETGTPIRRLPDGTLADLLLQPGERRNRYLPRPGTARIELVSGFGCDGTALLEYDTPNG